MSEAHLTQPELPDLISLLASIFQGSHLVKYLYIWRNVIYSLIVVLVMILLAYFATRKRSLIPESRLQNAIEVLVGLLDDFVCGILGKDGRKYTPFIGTLFIYILFMNLLGLVPLMKSATVSWSTTLALAICVFIYVQYTAIKELGLLGYLDHLAGKPRGAMAVTIVLPLLTFMMHILSELVKPISLSLRLRSNIWGDDIFLAVLAGFGIKGLPLLFFNTLFAILTSVVQAVVFCLLSTIYFAVFLTGEEKTQTTG